MLRQLGESCREIAGIEVAEPGKVTGDVDQQLIPDAAGIAVNDPILAKIKTDGEIGR